ncbi:MAG: hypothetical protein ABI700_07830, partial [Chloroflexota bacterium]
MDLLTHTEDRRLLFRMAALSLAALLLAAALGLAMTVYVSLGHQVLGRYGLQDLSAAQRGIGAGLLARLLPAGLVLSGLACAGFVLLLAGYRRSISAQVTGLSAYLRQIEAGDYALDVRDNGEGNFSLLKNDLYKVTVRLREQAE